MEQLWIYLCNNLTNYIAFLFVINYCMILIISLYKLAEALVKLLNTLNETVKHVVTHQCSILSLCTAWPIFSTTELL